MKVRRNAFASVAVVPTLVAAALVVALVVVIGSAQAAAPTTKPYVALFESPVAAGASDTVELVLENHADPQTLGSANVTAQPGFMITGADVVGGGDVDGTTFPTTLLKLRNLEIAPDTSRTITIDVTTPCSTDPDDEWGMRAKQSNDFSGTPGNDFSLDEGNSNLHTDVGGAGGTAAALSFKQQPSDAAKLTPIAPAVEVEVLDTCGNATAPSGYVSLTLVQPDDTTFGGGGELGGTVPQPLSSGVATFNDLTVSESGVGYKLEASYSGLEVESDPFDVYDALCPPVCTASNQAGTQIGIEGFDGSAGLSVGPTVNTADCGSLTPLGSTFGIVPLSGAATDVYTATLTIPKPGLQGVGVSNVVVCVSPTPGGTLTPLGMCAKKKPFTEKCIVSKTSSNAGDAIITMLFDGDPFGGGFS